MRNIGIILFCIGAIWAIIAFNAETTVTTRGEYIGGRYFSGSTVKNMGLMDDRRNNLMMSGVMVIVGAILFAVGTTKSPSKASFSSGTRKCPHCAEIVKSEAVICRYCNNKLERIMANDQESPFSKILKISVIKQASQAENINLEFGDIIKSYNEIEIHTNDDLSNAMAKAKNEKISIAELIIIRGATLKTYKIQLNQPLGVTCVEELKVT